MTNQKVVFIDRDGTINKSVPYLDNYADFEFYSETIEGLSLLIKNNFKIVLVTNQSGIGRGYFSLKVLNNIHRNMLLELKSENILISGIYFCPHTPEDDCNCRKPKVGMLEKASLDLSIKPNNSYMIGDRLSDIQAGQNFGCVSILVETGYGKSESMLFDKEQIIPNKITKNIQTAAQWIVDNEN
tara:strand:- start:3827 stop:4381 length:555 start_codon:yes stop_codon:yes gene_type:complete